MTATVTQPAHITVSGRPPNSVVIALCGIASQCRVHPIADSASGSAAVPSIGYRSDWGALCGSSCRRVPCPHTAPRGAGGSAVSRQPDSTYRGSPDPQRGCPDVHRGSSPVCDQSATPRNNFCCCDGRLNAFVVFVILRTLYSV